MTALSDADVAKVIQALEARGYSVRQREAAGAPTPKVLLEEKHFRRIEKFSGDSSKWQEWLFAVCVAVGSVSAECVFEMEKVIKEAGAVRDVVKIGDVINTDVKDKFASELFSVFCSLTCGEANVVVRGIIQKGAGYCGFAALCMLSQRFNPKTPARVLQFLATVLNPAPVKDVRLLERAVEEWEIKVGKLKVEFGEEFSDNVKVAIITGMIPRDLQDMVFQMGRAGEDLKYREVRDKVMSIASHRAQMATPTPMDIGRVGDYHYDYNDGEFEQWGETGPELDVDAVGASVVCHRCGGWGHMARDCPTPDTKGSKGKGAGKSGDVGQKGWGKGSAKAIGKGSFPRKGYPGKGEPVGAKGAGKKGGGKGLGYQGTCWTCGLVGHKSAECNQMQVNEVAGEQGAGDVASVGGVWMIGQVSNQPGEQDSTQREVGGSRGPRGGGEWRLVAGRWRPRVPDLRSSIVEVTKGRFESLDVCPVEEERQAEEAEEVCGVQAEITVDSAADESVCPRQWAEQFGTGPKRRDLKLVNASGGPIAHYGSRKVAFQPDGTAGRILGVGFEVTDVRKPLMSVKRICERGNIVQFGPEESFIQNLQSGEKLKMHKRGNSYVLRGAFTDVNPF